MAYCFHEGESIDRGAKRIAREQVDRAIKELGRSDGDRAKAVHEVRKCCKRIRGLLRLVRGELEADNTYRFENECFRDAARALSGVRDVEAVVEAYDGLVQWNGADSRNRADSSRDTLAPVWKGLAARRRRITADGSELNERAAAVLGDMRQARKRVADWPISAAMDFAPLGYGLKNVYRRGRDAMYAAYQDPTTENFHEWRKRVKYHRYHNRLLIRIWEPLMRVSHGEVEDLSDLLGNEHDLAVLRQLLVSAPDEFGGQATVEAFAELIDRRRAVLQATAKALGERVFAEKPKHLHRRFASYWETWRLEEEVRHEKGFVLSDA